MFPRMNQNQPGKFALSIALSAGIVIAIVALAFGQRVSARDTLAGTVSSTASTNPFDYCPADCQRQIVLARNATASYHEESNALADGFFSTVQCVAVPGVGAMGVHYINPGRMDLNNDVTQPEVLLYSRQSDGSMRLIGLEYVAPVISNGGLWFNPNTPPPAIDNPAPSLFSRAFDGPMPGHEPGDPWHYDLHVWLWRDNPLGLFFPFNPKVSCQ